jgi:putative aldouronate transport system permease protein
MPGSGMTIDPVSIPSDSIMFAMMVVTSLPMIFLFTLMQKYFVKGMVSGAVKG